MKSIESNIYISALGFCMRWSLPVFVIFCLILLSYILWVVLKKKTVKISFRKSEVFVLSILTFLSIPVFYLFRDNISDNGNSFLYKSAESLQTMESIVGFIMLVLLIYGFKYKNSYTYINLYIKILAIIEIVYLMSYCITDQFNPAICLNWLLMIILGIIFVVLNTVKLKLVTSKENLLNLNVHAATKEYDSLFQIRKIQADNLIDIIESEMSQLGYSICISGEWGSGKTSLANAIVKKAKKRENVKIFEIRINAMELDDNNSLINYFFKRIESILQENKIYTNVASEYKELVASISGTVISESMATFLSNKFKSGNTDYRASIDKLSDLLSANLSNARILIVIDDIERCSKEKVKSFLFFLKEIATMKRCVALFLVDIDKLHDCGFEKPFFDKFFNHTMSLAIVENHEIFSSLIKDKSDLIELRDEIDNIIDTFDNKINNIPENDKNRIISIESIEKDKRQFLNDLSNPRNATKIIEYYKTINDRIGSQISANLDNQSTIYLFLNKVNYKRQLSLLSLIHGLYSSEFILIEKMGINNYVRDLLLRRKTEKASDDTMLVASIVNNEWCIPLILKESVEYRIQEILRFIHCVLTDLNELPNISNGYSSLEEKVISDIKHDKLPSDITFSDIIDKIYEGTYNDLTARKNLIGKAFTLYAKKNIEHDKAFKLFSDSNLKGHISSTTSFLKMFYNAFCNDKRKVKNSRKKLENFRHFASDYLWRNLSICNRYFIPASLFDKVSIEMWNSIADSITFEKGSCSNMIDYYCVKCEKQLNINRSQVSVGIDRLNQIISEVDDRYRNLNISNSIDIQEAKKRVDDLVTEIKYLLDIEAFIINNSSEEFPTLLNIRQLSEETLSIAIKELPIMSDTISYDENTERYNYLCRLLYFICESKFFISLKEYEKLNETLEANFKIEERDVPALRQMLVFIFQNKIKSENS